MLDYSKKEPVIFPYKDWEIKKGISKEIVQRPIALVGLGSQNFKISALIDSGSDKTISYLYPFGILSKRNEGLFLQKVDSFQR